MQNSDRHMRGEAGQFLNYHRQSRIVEGEFYIMAMEWRLVKRDIYTAQSTLLLFLSWSLFI